MTIVEHALSLWGFDGAATTLIATRENAVYSVDAASGRYALRLHRQGYRSDAQLAAELDWMAWLETSGLSVPAPILSLAGRHLQHVGGVQVDVLTWLEGRTLDVGLPTLSTRERRNLFHRLGQAMARLHIASDAWPSGRQCDRPAWDSHGLLGQNPLWGRFWDNPELTADERTLFLEFRSKAKDHLARVAHTLDYGLIHADLVPANVMQSGDDLHLIDFDDGGFGFRAFELATALLKHRDAPDYDVLEQAIIEGYGSLRPSNAAMLPLFLALRAATYVGWNIARLDEDSSGNRNARFIAQANSVINAYLGQPD